MAEKEFVEKLVTIYTDGACEPNPGVGGWAAILFFGPPASPEAKKEISGSLPQTTNNIAEITAVIEGLKALKRPCYVRIYSDSQYVVNAIGTWASGHPCRPEGWLVSWEANGWRRKEGELKNATLWQELLALVRQHKSIEAIWLRGHNGDEHNERCDQLATEARLRPNR